MPVSWRANVAGITGERALHEGAGADVDVGRILFRPAEGEHRRGLVAVDRRKRHRCFSYRQRAEGMAGGDALGQKSLGQSEQRQQFQIPVARAQIP